MFKKMLFPLIAFSLLGIAVSNVNKTTYRETNNEAMIKDVGGENENHVEVKEVVDLLNENEFEAKFQGKLKDVKVNSKEGHLASKEVNGNIVQYQLSQNSKVGTYYIEAKLQNNERVSKKVFSYNYKDKLYFSDLSKDNAFKKAVSYDYENGLITYDQLMEEYYRFTGELVSIKESVNTDENTETKGIVIIDPAIVSNHYLVTAEIKYTDRDGNELPLTGAKAQLKTSGGTLLSTAYSDESGVALFSFDYSSKKISNAKVIVYAESETFTVGTVRFSTTPYAAHSFSNGLTWTLSYGVPKNLEVTIPYDTDSEVVRSFTVFQATSRAQRIAKMYSPTSLTDGTHQNIIYGLDFYTAVNNIVSFFSGSNLSSFSYCGWSVIAYDDFGDWQTITHEYGHYVEYCNHNFNIWLDEYIAFGGPEHSDPDNHFEDKHNKYFAMKLTWTEAWAEVFSMICYDEDPVVSDSVYADYSYETYHYDTHFTATDNSGEAQERAVANYLYNLYDGIDSAHNDLIHLGAAAFFNATMTPGIYTLTDFVKSFNTTYSRYNANGLLLEIGHIAPNNLTIYFNGNDSIRFDWFPGGEGGYPNNRFDLEFYRPNGTRVYTISSINIFYNYDYDYPMTYYASYNEVSELASLSNGQPLKVAVKGYRVDPNTTSGPYMSSFEELDFGIYGLSAVERNIGEGFGYVKETFALYDGSRKLYKYNYYGTGTLLFQTSGTADTKLRVYDENRNLIAQSNNEGNGSNAFVSVRASGTTSYYVETSIVNFNGASYLNTCLIVSEIDGYYNSFISKPNSINDLIRFDNLECLYFPFFLESKKTRSFIITVKNDRAMVLDAFSKYGFYLHVLDLSSAYPMDGVTGSSGQGSDHATRYANLYRNHTYMVIISRGYYESNSTEWDTHFVFFGLFANN